MPKLYRIILALLASAVAAPIPLILFLMASKGGANKFLFLPSFWMMFSEFGLILAIMFGLPAFLILNHFNAVKWWTSVLAGFAIGCILPTTAYGFPNHFNIHMIFFGGILGVSGGFFAWLVYQQTEPTKNTLPKEL